VFSHIRKTYRVQWVVLEGGGPSPPALATRSASVSDHKKTNVASLAKLESMWIRLVDVEKANIGTGVLKVWSQARSLWEGKR